ncbi:MAG TPA: hypothetical protein VFY91_05430 [Microbacterium sp.]|nr:hypothetical protein [Microbacterium sp.]
MDLTVILLVVAAWIAVAVVVALVYGRVVARADHDRDMKALEHEVRAKDAARTATTLTAQDTTIDAPQTATPSAPVVPPRQQG